MCAPGTYTEHRPSCHIACSADQQLTHALMRAEADTENVHSSLADWVIPSPKPAPSARLDYAGHAAGHAGPSSALNPAGHIPLAGTSSDRGVPSGFRHAREEHSSAAAALARTGTPAPGVLAATWSPGRPNVSVQGWLGSKHGHAGLRVEVGTGPAAAESDTMRKCVSLGSPRALARRLLTSHAITDFCVAPRQDLAATWR